MNKIANLNKYKKSPIRHCERSEAIPLVIANEVWQSRICHCESDRTRQSIKRLLRHFVPRDDGLF